MNKKSKNLIIIYSGDDWEKEIPFKDINTRKAYEYFYDNTEKYNIKTYRASIKWYNKEKNVFTKTWSYRNGKWLKIEKEIIPHLIFDKLSSKDSSRLKSLKNKLATLNKMINPPQFRLLLDSKLNQYLFFQKFMATTFLANNKDELKQNIKKIKTTKAVIKPLYGYGGFDVQIAEKNKLLNKKIKYPIIVQEFIDGSNGIPGQKNNLADLRVVFVNNKITYALSRVATKKSLFTNYHQGATAHIINKKEIPQSVIKICKEINEMLSVFPNYHFSLDFIFKKNNQPILIELNTVPGFVLLEILSNKRALKSNLESLIKMFLDI